MAVKATVGALKVMAAAGLLSVTAAMPLNACVSRADAETGPSQAAAPAESADSLVEQIASLEVEKALQSVVFTPDSPVLTNLNLKQAALRDQLQGLQLSTPIEPQIAIATQTALTAKLEEVETAYRQDSIRFTDDHPIQQRRLAQLEALRQALQ